MEPNIENHKENTLLKNIIQPLVDLHNETHPCFGIITDAIIHQHDPLSQPYCSIQINCMGANHTEMSASRRYLRKIEKYGHLNGRLGLMTFEVNQGISVHFPTAKFETYLFLTIPAPSEFDPGLYREYIQDLISFLNLKCYHSKKDAKEDASDSMFDHAMIRDEADWKMLLFSMDSAGHRLRELFHPHLIIPGSDK